MFIKKLCKHLLESHAETTVLAHTLSHLIHNLRLRSDTRTTVSAVHAVGRWSVWSARVTVRVAPVANASEEQTTTPLANLRHTSSPGPLYDVIQSQGFRLPVRLLPPTKHTAANMDMHAFSVRSR